MEEIEDVEDVEGVDDIDDVEVNSTVKRGYLYLAYSHLLALMATGL